MILVRFSGGLGNQMFQFAMYEKLKKEYPDMEVRGDLSFYTLEQVHNGFELERVFSVIKKGYLQKATWRDHWTCRRELPVPCGGRAGKVLETPVAWMNARTRNGATAHHIERIEEEPYIMRLSAAEKSKRRAECLEKLNNLDASKHYYVDGYWQDEAYFTDTFQTVIDELQFTQLHHYPKVTKLAQTMQNQESVSVHLRCGDYLNSDYDVLNAEYYRKALEHLRTLTTIEQVYVFSDDVEKAKGFLAESINAVFVEGHQGNEDWLDMYLMSQCKHHVLANSSFSTWAAYIGNTESSITIYPSKYTKQDENLYRKNWVRMELE